MPPKQRTRPIQILFCVNEQEKKLLDRKLENSEFSNMGAFIRKMLLTGYIINLDLKEINKLVSISSHLSNNLNQLAKKANSYEAITNEDMKEMKESIKNFNFATKQLLKKVGEL